ncbi:magnesium-translocating P-type ATPase [Microbacterium sp. SYP-A9085]|uniref:magnesium-translocating P-type ATPase n=1 Tax=Microbacterium sp. SYP-A9085 TaxID=2664454 RepID=UPI00129A4A08|nr:magnesium-translocating P-type ATPase [Microbacterium sp. SYP-A9085]
MRTQNTAPRPAADDISPVRRAAGQDTAGVVSALGTTFEGLSQAEAEARRQRFGPNALREHRARPLRVLWRQVRNPILILLCATALVSAFVGESVDALTIGVILAISVGLGFVNEFRAERSAVALHERLRHTAIVLRDRARTRIDVTQIVPGDVIVLSVGAVVPADLRLLEVTGLECDEGIVTGESIAAVKSTEPVDGVPAVGDLTCCALMGTVVQAGSGVGVAVAIGTETEFGRIAVGLDAQEPVTEFQRGLGQFSTFLLVIAVLLTSSIFVGALLLGRPVIDSLLFSLAIAVGITPQLLPAVVSASLAAGSRRLALRRVIVKRIVCIEDLGDLDLLVTDKTGTLTTGTIIFERAVPIGEATDDRLVLLGLLATEVDLQSPSAVGLPPLDAALWSAAAHVPAPVSGYHRRDARPFDHERRMIETLVSDPDGMPLVVVKGAAESVIPMCVPVSDTDRSRLTSLYQTGARVVAVASRPAPGATSLADDEQGLKLDGFLVFSDGVKADAAASLARLAALEVKVKVATGDSAAVAVHVCTEIGMDVQGTLTGDEIDAFNDGDLADAAVRTTIFARVSPEQKARVIRALRQKGRAVGFLGDGVNDALALHRADVGISVDSAVDVAKDAADMILLDKDLGVLADGVSEGRRIFANTIKYVLMGTSSNFGNMFSASIASMILPFLPMLPGQILLNNLLYDSSQLAIPTDNVDAAQLRAPSHWDIAAIRRFMLLFGPISSVFDFATFALMLFAFRAAPSEFRSGWFIESIATQTLIVFAVRTHRVPFTRSRPSLALAVCVLAVVAVGAWLPYSPLTRLLGFTPLPALFFLALVAMVIAYLVLVEAAKILYYRRLERTQAKTKRHRAYPHRIARRAARFSVRAP